MNLAKDLCRIFKPSKPAPRQAKILWPDGSRGVLVKKGKTWNFTTPDHWEHGFSHKSWALNAITKEYGGVIVLD